MNNIVKLKLEMEGIWSKVLGRKIVANNMPVEFTEENLAKWSKSKINFSPIYIPEIDITECFKMKGWIRPDHRFFQMIKDGQVSKNATKITVGWRLIDKTLGVDCTDGSQMLPNDYFISPLVVKLREQSVIGKYDNTPLGSRFSIIPKNEWPLVFKAVREALGIGPEHSCRFPSEAEFNVIGNLFDENLGKFNIWEWLDDIFGDANRLIGGHRVDGGLSDVGYFLAGRRNGFVAGRPLVSFV